MQRILIRNGAEGDAYQALGDADINFDLDSGDRIMVEDEDLDDACEALDESDADIRWDII